MLKGQFVLILLYESPLKEYVLLMKTIIQYCKKGEGIIVMKC